MPKGREAALEVEVDVDGHDLDDVAPRGRPQDVCEARAVHADDDYFGYTVNKTARIASAAGGNEILVTESIAKSLSDLDGFTLGDPRPLKLKGLPGTHIAYVLALK